MPTDSDYYSLKGEALKVTFVSFLLARNEVECFVAVGGGIGGSYKEGRREIQSVHKSGLAGFRDTNLPDYYFVLCNPRRARWTDPDL